MAKLDQMQEDAKMDMTPMIDCVFLLMIFFVLIIDLSQQDLEDLILPMAKYAVPDEDPADVRPIVNITQSGRVVYKMNTYYDPEVDGDNIDGIKNLLLEWKNTIVKDKTQEIIAGRSITVVNDPILIRADKWTEWHFVGLFMTGCSQPEAAFWKLELAMSEKDKEIELMKGR